MKKLTLLLVLITALTFGQGTIGVNVSLDNKLTFVGDDIGNDPFTLDISTHFIMQEFERKITYYVSGYIQLGVKFEYANLNGGYFNRYGAEVGYTFLYNDLNVGLMPFVGNGILIREGKGATRSWEVGATAHYKILPKLKIITTFVFTERTDIGTSFRFNMNTGVQIEL